MEYSEPVAVESIFKDAEGNIVERQVRYIRKTTAAKIRATWIEDETGVFLRVADINGQIGTQEAIFI
jgi:hypothetical protein